MAVKKGQYASVSFTAGATPITVAKLRNWSINVATNKIDTSAAGQDWESHEIGMGNWSGSAEFIDADQYWLSNIFDKFTVEFFDSEDDTDPVYTGTCSLDFDRSVPYDDVISTTVTITGDGELQLGS